MADESNFDAFIVSFTFPSNENVQLPSELDGMMEKIVLPAVGRKLRHRPTSMQLNYGWHPLQIAEPPLIISGKKPSGSGCGQRFS